MRIGGKQSQLLGCWLRWSSFCLADLSECSSGEGAWRIEDHSLLCFFLDLYLEVVSSRVVSKGFFIIVAWGLVTVVGFALTQKWRRLFRRFVPMILTVVWWLIMWGLVSAALELLEKLCRLGLVLFVSQEC